MTSQSASKPTKEVYMTIAQCSYEQCLKPTKCHGYCNGHYQQLYRGEELRALKRTPRKCQAESCSRQASSMKYCSKHDQRYRKYGDPDYLVGAHHNLSGTPEYRAWVQMRYRCNNVNCKYYKNYGGRGIEVCKRWDSFTNFLQDVGKRPDPTYSIDRIDNDGNYEPSNCRWADKKTQVRNRREVKNKSGYQGIVWDKSKNWWLVRIRVGERPRTFGYFRNLNDAIKKRAIVLEAMTDGDIRTDQE